MRICIVYDCLYPWTVGGGERWYQQLAERLAAEGNEVTYLTLRQWDRGVDASYAGVVVRAVGPRMALYTGSRRRILPPLVFGVGVLWHLLWHGRGYDAVHTSSFPYFSLLAAGLLRRHGRYRVTVDWFEVWTRVYWREYLGRAAGTVGHAVQALCTRIPQRAFCFSRLHRDRLVEGGLESVAVLEGLYAGDLSAPESRAADPIIVFAGRHIPEKRVPALVPAISLARAQIPGLRAVIFGDGPERPAVLGAIEKFGVADAVSAPGFVDAGEVDATMRRALCMVLPSSREGFGLVVIEAAARGTPSIVVSGEDNAAAELLEDGVNGVIAPSADPEALAAAIVRVQREGLGMRERTCTWFAENADRLSLDASLCAVMASYAGAEAARPIGRSLPSSVRR